MLNVECQFLSFNIEHFSLREELESNPRSRSPGTAVFKTAALNHSTTPPRKAEGRRKKDRKSFPGPLLPSDFYLYSIVTSTVIFRRSLRVRRSSSRLSVSGTLTSLTSASV